MFCLPVDESVMARSVVLQALHEASAEGVLSHLPKSIYRGVFCLWAATKPEGKQAYARS